MSWKKEIAKGVLQATMDSFFTSAASHISERLFARREEETVVPEEAPTLALGFTFDDSDWHW